VTFTGISVVLNAPNVNNIDFVFFEQQPSETFTDAAAFPSLGATSRAMSIRFYSASEWTAGSSQAIGQSPTESRFFKCADGTNTQSIWVVPVYRGAATLTLAAASDAILTLRGPQF
jgi:hypothetical protein